jgi:arylsulfatase A-like enzyme
MPGNNARFDPTEKLMPRFFQEEGYKTAVFGKWHLGSAEKSYLPHNHGFETFSGHVHGCIDYFTHQYGCIEDCWYVDNEPTIEQGYSTDLIADYAIDFIEKRNQDQKPFFLYVPFNAPHYGKTDATDVPNGTLNMKSFEYQGCEMMNTLQAPPDKVDQFEHIKDEYRRYYSAMVSSLDDNVGRILQQLKETGQFDNTMIWFISDNGGYSESYFNHADNGDLRGEKATLYEGGIRIPAVMCWQGMIPSGQTQSQPLCTMDLLPTFAALFGFEDKLQNLPIDGLNMNNVLFNREKLDRAIIWIYGDKSAIRKGSWKLYNGSELYNLDTDHSEQKNLAKEHPEKVEELVETFTEINATISDYVV